MPYPKSNAEARLSAAEPCGVVRDGYTMTMVRKSDVDDVLASLEYYRGHAGKLDAELTKVLSERNAVICERAGLQARIDRVARAFSE